MKRVLTERWQNATIVVMGQPVKLSDQLILDARLVSQLSERSIAGQIEHWAQLGRAIELILDGAQSLALRRSGAVRPCSELLASVDSDEGRNRVNNYLAAQPFPHYEASTKGDGLLVRTSADGTRIEGRFINGQFHLAEE